MIKYLFWACAIATLLEVVALTLISNSLDISSLSWRYPMGAALLGVPAFRGVASHERRSRQSRPLGAIERMTLYSLGACVVAAAAKPALIVYCWLASRDAVVAKLTITQDAVRTSIGLLWVASVVVGIGVFGRRVVAPSKPRRDRWRSIRILRRAVKGGLRKGDTWFRARFPHALDRRAKARFPGNKTE